jgi:hypothetical protein
MIVYMQATQLDLNKLHNGQIKHSIQSECKTAANNELIYAILMVTYHKRHKNARVKKVTKAHHHPKKNEEK